MPKLAQSWGVIVHPRPVMSLISRWLEEVELTSIQTLNILSQLPLINSLAGTRSLEGTRRARAMVVVAMRKINMRTWEISLWICRRLCRMLLPQWTVVMETGLWLYSWAEGIRKGLSAWTRLIVLNSSMHYLLVITLKDDGPMKLTSSFLSICTWRSLKCPWIWALSISAHASSKNLLTSPVMSVIIKVFWSLASVTGSSLQAFPLTSRIQTSRSGIESLQFHREVPRS